jgi:hypothetical protein
VDDRFVSFSTLDLKNKFWFSGSLGSFFGENSLVLSMTARVLSFLSFHLLGTHLGFDFGADARFQLGSLANLCFGPQPVFFFSL